MKNIRQSFSTRSFQSTMAARSSAILIFLLLSVSILSGYSGPDSVLVIGDIQIMGNTVTKSAVIFREMSMQRGDTLKQENIERDKNNIYNLGLFNKVDIEYSVYRGEVSLFIIVTERWYFFPYPIAGFRYRDASKLYYGGGVIHSNFRGWNERIISNAVFGYDRWFSLSYQNPRLTDDGEYFFSGNCAIQKLHSLNTRDEEYENLNIYLSGTVGKRFGLYQTLSGSLDYQIWQVNDPLLSRTVSSSGRDAFLTAGLFYRYDTRNNREYTTDGTLITVSAAKIGFGEAEVNLAAAGFDVRTFFGLRKGGSFGLRTAGSFIWGGIVPPYKHAFLGYDERIRGHFYISREAENRLVVNAEIRLPILLPRSFDINLFDMPQLKKLRYGVYLALFADAGKLWWRNQRVMEQPWYTGAGAGFQFLLPYGIIIRTEAACNDQGGIEGFVDFDVSF